MGLNSTMVRLQLNQFHSLKTCGNPVSIPLWFDYNSEKGEIFPIREVNGLNSTMVRLQHLPLTAFEENRESGSQFHYGSITTFFGDA